jgi:hypothetical protein
MAITISHLVAQFDWPDFVGIAWWESGQSIVIKASLSNDFRYHDQAITIFSKA